MESMVNGSEAVQVIRRRGRYGQNGGQKRDSLTMPATTGKTLGEKKTIPKRAPESVGISGFSREPVGQLREKLSRVVAWNRSRMKKKCIYTNARVDLRVRSNEEGCCYKRNPSSRR